MIEILETCEKDLGDVQWLWADGDVMRYVGFPEGVRQSNEEMGAMVRVDSKVATPGEPLFRI